MHECYDCDGGGGCGCGCDCDCGSNCGGTARTSACAISAAAVSSTYSLRSRRCTTAASLGESARRSAPASATCRRRSSAVGGPGGPEGAATLSPRCAANTTSSGDGVSNLNGCTGAVGLNPGGGPPAFVPVAAGLKGTAGATGYAA
eukprot:1177004-Prorocentrum_minimum.AAC.2